MKNSIQPFNTSPKDIIAWIGPHISQGNYPVGESLRNEFLAIHPSNNLSFKLIKNKWHLSLLHCATSQLKALGVSEIYTDSRCTFENKQKFYSHRQGDKKGRMLACIWINQ
jgi:polyphenol oxidase